MFSFMCLYYLYLLMAECRSKHVVENNNKKMYSVHVLCLCALVC